MSQQALSQTQAVSLSTVARNNSSRLTPRTQQNAFYESILGRSTGRVL
ncbi:hypothetical protein MAL08_00900 [Leptospira noguchii]|nr:hypothetical protein [Leptospira noguchii]UOG39604.1 hypothetical protein MAL08_00900 [Leptospira noguchii]